VAWKSNTTAIIQNCLAKSGCNTARSTPAMKTKTVNWRNCKAILIAPHISGRFLNINKCVPTFSDQPTSLDSPDLSSVHMIGKEEEKRQSKHGHVQPNFLVKML